MDTVNTINQQFTQFFNTWSKSEGQIRLYGPDMPQSQQVLKTLFETFGTVFNQIPSFTIVKNSHQFEIFPNDDGTDGDNCQIESSDYTDQAAQTFERFNIHSLTFYKKLTLPELEQFFHGLHMSPQEARQIEGLTGFLKDHAIEHIQINRIRLEAKSSSQKSRRSKAVSEETEQALEDLLRQATTGLSVSQPVRKKAFASTWERYLTDQLDTSEFQARHQSMINLALEKPEMFVRALQHMAAKQEQIETFLANLEQKLFSAGFPHETVDQILDELGRPKQVLISEAELARLRQIEKNYQPDLADRIEESLAEIQTLQQKLSDERERSDAILHQTSQGVMVLDPEGRILDINPIAQKILGMSAQEARGQSYHEVTQDHHMLTIVSDWNNETETHTPKEVTIEYSNHETRDTIRESGIVIEDKNGRSIGEVSSLHDVIKERELEQRKNDILDVLGHDLRAPLNIIKQSIDLITDFIDQPDTLSPDKQKEFLQATQRHIGRMEKLINKVLDARQLETGKILLKIVPTDPQKLIEDAAHSLDTWAEEKQITIHIDIQALPEVQCDPERIYQIVTNFISNALKFTPEKGKINVHAKPTDIANQPAIEVSVSDSGMGIETKDLERIFHKYEQVSLKQPKGVSGLGLGLSICKSIVDMHHGLIWASSTPGQGSTFTFRIPVDQTDVA